MSLLSATHQLLRTTDDPRREAARALESLVLKQLIATSGAFKGGEAAGAHVWSDVFAEAISDAVASSGHGLGLGPLPLPARDSTAFPLPSGAAAVTSSFGTRVDPFTGQPRAHTGVDLAAPAGTPILAAQAGVVVFAGPRGGYGNAVEVSHPDGTTSLYAHADTVRVQRGQQVHAGEVIATVGSTGRSTGNHLHFEVRVMGRPVDPRTALKKYGVRVEAPVEHHQPDQDRSP
ncbi:MAG: M23 family metallopeptidase [Myxococcales bacterium]|nr:M23 family metallopeptidase [Myxococcales bacterium]